METVGCLVADQKKEGGREEGGFKVQVVCQTSTG